MYLTPINNTLLYSHYANYDQAPPFVPPVGFQWVEGTPAHDAVSIIDNVLQTVEKLKLLFNDLPVPLKAAFSPLKAAVLLEIQEANYNVAYEIVRATEVDPQYEELKISLLQAIQELE
jgi:hypothetical protein